MIAKFDNSQECTRGSSWAVKADLHNIQRYKKRINNARRESLDLMCDLKDDHDGSTLTLQSAKLSSIYTPRCPASFDEWYNVALGHWLSNTQTSSS